MPSGFASLPASSTTSVCSPPGNALNLKVQEVLFFCFFLFLQSSVSPEVMWVGLNGPVSNHSVFVVTSLILRRLGDQP